MKEKLNVNLLLLSLKRLNRFVFHDEENIDEGLLTVSLKRTKCVKYP